MKTNLVVVGSWAVDGECLTITLVMVSLYQWELDLRVVELFDVVTTGLGGDNLLDFDDLKCVHVEIEIVNFKKNNSYLD